MHSRIFQVTCEPISKDEYRDSEYYEGLIQDADYVTDCNREEGIDWLSDYLKDCANFECVDGDWRFKLKEDYRIIYFNNKYSKFVETAKLLSGISIYEFVNGSCEFSLFELQQAYNHDYSFHMDVDDEVGTLDNFMRYARSDATYYIGAVMDYHS